MMLMFGGDGDDIGDEDGDGDVDGDGDDVGDDNGNDKNDMAMTLMRCMHFCYCNESYFPTYIKTVTVI